MMNAAKQSIPGALALLLGLGLGACNPGRPPDDAAPAPVDSGIRPDTSAATPPITPPSETRPDSPPAEASRPSAADGQPETSPSLKVSRLEYEGWRQYSVHCARCHGQDALPNPVAANLLNSLAPGGPTDSPQSFFKAVSEGRPERGMPAFKTMLTPDQVNAIYGYLKGRAEGRIKSGRPVSSGA